MPSSSANSGRTAKGRRKPGGKPKGKPRGRPWKPGESGNPSGRPAEGRSWSGLISEIGELRPSEAASRCRALAAGFRGLGDGASLRELVVIRSYASLISEPSPGLLRVIIEKGEGTIREQALGLDWRAEALEQGINPDELLSYITATLRGDALPIRVREVVIRHPGPDEEPDPDEEPNPDED